jgi:hypothetical protein
VSKDVEKFKGWAEGNGGVIEPTTNPFELARVRHADGVIVIYQGKRGVSFSDSIARKAWAKFKQGAGFPLAKRHRRSKTEETVYRLSQRDGLRCWFCGCDFDENNRQTVEHLLSVCHGGNNNLANLVLACQPCNSAAGNLPIAVKVTLRTV